METGYDLCSAKSEQRSHTLSILVTQFSVVCLNISHIVSGLISSN
jgi:hypothetical protein